MSGVALADVIVRNGCEWKQAENGNYFTRVDPGCSIGHNGNASERKIWLDDEDEDGGDEDAGDEDGGDEDGGDEDGGEAA